MKMLDWAGGVFRWVGGAVAPMFVRPVPPVPLAWFAHALLVLVLLVAAYLVQWYRPDWFDLGNVPDRIGWFKRWWLTAVVLLVYLLAWAAGYLRDMLAPTKPETRYPDLDEAWAGVEAALAAQGVPLRATPVYLVLGEMPAGYEPFFRAIPHGLSVTGGTPADWSVQVFANRDAVFLTLPGASLLGAHTLLSGVVELTGASPTDSLRLVQSIGIGGSIRAGFGSLAMGSVRIGGGGGGAGGSLAMGSIGASIGAALSPNQAEIERIVRKAREEGRKVTDAERERMKELAGSPRGGGAGGGKAAEGAGNVLRNPALLAEAEGRVAHLCDLLAAARWPSPPASGIILAVPAAALEQEADALQMGEVVRHDLGQFERHLRLRVPVFVVVGGLETLAGGDTFFEKFAAGQSHRRLGKGFPLAPSATPEQVTRGVDGTAAWVLGDLLPYSALKLTRVTSHPAADAAENAGLFRFLDGCRRRGAHLGKLLGRGLALPDRVPGFAGCYVTAVLPSNPTEAAFAKELFAKVVGTAGSAAWTPAALDRDAAFRRAGWAANLAAAALVLVVLGLAGYVGVTKFGLGGAGR